nr:uncharacterized protein LOC116429706 isoform X1 [Nomia melanderi]XP_031838812.1 uncharacterized protein LOC116429706 isoform X1 [Nomia melanderi]
MNYKVPIRTYGRNKCKEVTISLQKLNISTINKLTSTSFKKESVTVDKKSDSNDSLFHDPFETTFDRLLKDTKSSKQSSKTNIVNALKSNEQKDSDLKISVSEARDDKYLLYDDIKVPNVSLKRVLRRKRNEKTIMEVQRKIIRKNTLVKNNNVYKKKLRKAKTKKKLMLSNSNISSSQLISEFKDYYINDRKISEENYGKNHETVNSVESLKMKSGVLILDGSNISAGENKMNRIKKKSKKQQGHMLENHELIKYAEMTKENFNLKYDNICMKHCFVKIKKLERSFMKPSHPIKKFENIMSSTPIGRPIRPTKVLNLSPISITYSEKLNESMTCTDKSPGASNSNLVPVENLHINIDVSEKFDTSKKHVLNKSDKMLFVCETDTSNYINNSNKKQRKCAMQETFNKFCEIAENVSGTEMNEHNPLYVSSMKKEYIPSNKVQKRHLNFSLDEDRSQSLFDDTNENKISLHNKVKENAYDSVIVVKSKSTNISIDGIECKSETEELDLKKNNVNMTKEAKTPGSINKRLSANKVIAINDKSNNAIEPCIILTQLQDPFRITKKRKQYRKWELDLTNITEDCDNSFQLKKTRMSIKEVQNSKRTNLSRRTLRSIENIPETRVSNVSTKIEKPIYLKAGKSWARSLSILNSIQNESNLDKLSIGKGKQWRNSVVDILNMQKQGIFQSCIRKTESDKDLQASIETVTTSEHELDNKKGRTCDSTSLGRPSKRISVRVVPINKTLKSIEDAQFLEVYGIVPVKSQRFTLINSPQKSCVFNVQDDDIDGHINNEHVILAAKEVILEKCSQQDYIPFSTYFSDSYLNHCRKIGEGVYGEVFLYEHNDKKSVIKIIPIEGNEYVNGEPQKKFHEILSEIVIAMELHNLRFNPKYNTDGFVEVENIKCLKGKYPKKLVDLWTIYDEEKHSENDCPSMFNENQLYIILELGHGGQDLEAFVFPTADEAYALFVQAALALAVAEKAVEFEHRDLHWGNILISPTTESHIHYKLGKKRIQLISKGVKVSIIDFTLSRVTYQGCSVFNDLASDPSLFTAQGEYQFEIYRLMKDKIKNNWQTFEPYTNILWLHYTLDKMITAVRYRRKTLKAHKNGIIKLKELKNEILSYTSAFDFITNCNRINNLLCTDSESHLASILKEEMIIA